MQSEIPNLSLSVEGLKSLVLSSESVAEIFHKSKLPQLYGQVLKDAGTDPVSLLHAYYCAHQISSFFSDLKDYLKDFIVENTEDVKELQASVGNFDIRCQVRNSYSYDNCEDYRRLKDELKRIETFMAVAAKDGKDFHKDELTGKLIPAAIPKSSSVAIVVKEKRSNQP